MRHVDQLKTRSEESQAVKSTHGAGLSCRNVCTSPCFVSAEGKKLVCCASCAQGVTPLPCIVCLYIDIEVTFLAVKMMSMCRNMVRLHRICANGTHFSLAVRLRPRDLGCSAARRVPRPFLSFSLLGLDPTEQNKPLQKGIKKAWRKMDSRQPREIRSRVGAGPCEIIVFAFAFTHLGSPPYSHR